MLVLYMSMLEDENDRKLFEEIYLSNRKLMVNVAKGILGSYASAEDAVHNAFIRIANHVEKFSSITCNERRSLCVTIVRNISLDMRRDSHLDKVIPLDENISVQDETDISDEILRFERLSDLERCIQALEPTLRDVVELRLVLGYNTEETAVLLGISKEAVRVRLHRARAKLKEYLMEEGYTHV